MKLIRTILTVFLAILWLPVTSHCLIFDSAPGYEYLSCCTHTEAVTVAEHHEDDCAADSCALVESALYKSALQRITVPPLGTSVVFELPPLLQTALPYAVISMRQTNDILARLPVGWQFSTRTALPGRAPSFIS